MNESPPKNSAPAAPRLGRFALIAGVAIVILIILGMLPRWGAQRSLAAETRELAVTTVQVVSPVPGKSALGVPLPAEIRAYVEAPIYARASGYLKRWLVDLGAHVAAGQLLAEIDTPELDQQLAQARAELAQDQAALDLAKITAARWADLLKTASVSEQETAEKQADLKLKSAVVDAASANVRRLEEMKSFASVTAPFPGTITERLTDVGRLITAGNSTELFRLAQTQPLRVFVRVPQNLSAQIAAGQTAELAISELPGRKLEAKVVRTAGVMEPGSRTLLVELELDNSRGDVLAGSYAQARFTGAGAAPVLTLPASTLLFRSEGIQVGVVGADGKVALRSVKLGRDFGQSVEILSGIAAEDRVIINPPDALTDGVAVKIAEAPAAVADK
jgi:RND family efflux transporter MFP subunit